ncbi:helix-turn-helix domain-containing protein [Natrinema salifodinae]|uniref:Predicted DNA binding protein, contains HTH domain n=1 Tax=Natrinema salifodinae TaxID=1202768 RepID=A0A1I0PFN8_9EURY|nr:helix-turn-helix domain-containing protein [Natrinema salifodinae]SEW13243.1 Predicted DNA binding protein, contains HTH domain [Natrinema salifodinae]
MRHVSYVLTPQRGYFDRGAERFRERGVTFDSIRNIDRLDDGTIITQKVVRGDRAALQDALEDTGPTVVDHQLIDAGDATILQLHYRPSDLTRELLAVHDRHAVVLEYPLEYAGPENRRLRVDEIGREDALRRVIEETRAIVDVEIERLGDYDPTDERLFATLTARQREVLRVAVEAGYYEEPRQVTYEDIAARLDCSPGTVGQHLRRIEARLMSTLVTGTGPRAESGRDRNATHRSASR